MSRTSAEPAQPATRKRLQALESSQAALMAAVQQGDILKVHRTMDGAKEYRLHPLAGGEPMPVSPRDVEALLAAELIASNMKFPAATYVPTARAQGWVEQP